MTNRVIGPGVSLPPPQIAYPSNLTGVPYTTGNAIQSLAPGQSIQIPAGDFFIDLGLYSILEIQDPVCSGTISQVSGVWRPLKTQRYSGPIRSDGVNFRISNLTGCAVSAYVTKGGTTYVQASTVVTPSTGNSTWVAIVGGRIAHLTCSITGAGYGLAPIVYIPQPPAPGVQASAVATISAGAVNGFTVLNQGAGYTTAPAITILPNPSDPSATSATTAVASCDLTGSGTVSAVLCTNNGAPVSTSMTLAITGGDNSCTITPSFLQTITAVTASAVGTGTITAAMLATIGGYPTSGIFLNPAIENQYFIPRQPVIQLGITSGALNGTNTIIDGGLYLGTPTAIVVSTGASGLTSTGPAVALTLGSANDTIIIQPL